MYQTQVLHSHEQTKLTTWPSPQPVHVARLWIWFFEDGPFSTSFSSIFVLSKLQLVEYWSLMSMMRLEPRTSGVGSNRSTNWATTTAMFLVLDGSINVYTLFQTLRSAVNWSQPHQEFRKTLGNAENYLCAMPPPPFFLGGGERGQQRAR